MRITGTRSKTLLHRAAVAVIGLTSLIRGNEPQHEGLLVRNPGFSVESLAPHMEYAIENEQLFRSIYSPTEAAAVRERLSELGSSIFEMNSADYMVFIISKSRCPGIADIGPVNTPASTSFNMLQDGRRLVQMCFQMLHGQDGKNPHDYWAVSWRDISDHEYKHLVQYHALGVNPFGPDVGQEFLDLSRASLRSNGLLPHLQTTPKDQASLVKFVGILSELFIYLRTVPGSTSLDPGVKEYLSGFQSGKIGIMSESVPVLALELEIVLRYLKDNALFRAKTGVTELTPAFYSNYAALLSVKDRLVQNDKFHALYEELCGYAKLAERDGFEFR